MGRLRCFSADIILRYNSRDLNGNEEDSSEFIMGVKENIFWKKAYTINEPLEDYPGNSIIAQEEMQFCLSCGWQNEEKTLLKNYFSLKYYMPLRPYRILFPAQLFLLTLF